ncbi:hypothetical protein [Aureispira anguillae]|nr:hypothetical protein [Aureispira anguillae]
MSAVLNCANNLFNSTSEEVNNSAELALKLRITSILNFDSIE